ncbi:hypothetical protein HPULCUR_009488 [Helicostylum pulchrum]|uniref:Uncharacterized protein n=1 Tax=Helicostylum pulchrum TaxID=562976 RepID=A0ABP9YAQ4_9FUNG
MSSIASLRRKDNMWIYKNPQGLQVLNDELNQRRKKRSSRHRYTTPPLSPTTLEPIIHISKINRVLQRPPSPLEEPKLVKAEEIQQQPIASVKPREEKNVKKLSVITSSSVQEKKDAIMKRSSVAEKDVGRVGRVAVSAVSVASPPARVASPPARVVSPPVRVASPPVKVALPPASPPERVISPPARVSSPPARVTSPPARVTSPPTRVSSPPIQTLSTSKSTTSPMSTPEKNFLLEAKRKLFSVQQQQQQNVIVKNLPVAPTKKKNGIVSSFISAFETTPPPPKPPRHVIIPPASSVSTPLNAAVVETIVPVTSCSSVIPTESYFSEVIDRRFSPTPAETEEEPIIVYLPQLSPDISFCTNALDIPPQTDQKRPCIKKQVSFSDQLSTFIPDNQSNEEEEEEEENVSTFVRTLSNELSDVISAVQTQQHREKFIPALLQKKKEVPVVFQKKEVQPQKLSNKLLDIFQKKPKVMMVQQPTSSSKELTHLTKTRAKPPSLKKPTMLTYPAAIAQPDWRTRAITTKKSSVFI